MCVAILTWAAWSIIEVSRKEVLPSVNVIVIKVIELFENLLRQAKVLIIQHLQRASRTPYLHDATPVASLLSSGAPLRITTPTSRLHLHPSMSIHLQRASGAPSSRRYTCNAPPEIRTSVPLLSPRLHACSAPSELHTSTSPGPQLVYGASCLHTSTSQNSILPRRYTCSEPSDTNQQAEAQQW